jgi:hypothetical protein
MIEVSIAAVKHRGRSRNDRLWNVDYEVADHANASDEPAIARTGFSAVFPQARMTDWAFTAHCWQRLKRSSK